MLETHEALIGFIDSWVSGKPGKILGGGGLYDGSLCLW